MKTREYQGRMYYLTSAYPHNGKKRVYVCKCGNALKGAAASSGSHICRDCRLKDKTP